MITFLWTLSVATMLYCAYRASYHIIRYSKADWWAVVPIGFMAAIPTYFYAMSMIDDEYRVAFYTGLPLVVLALIDFLWLIATLFDKTAGIARDFAGTAFIATMMDLVFVKAYPLFD